MLDVPNDLPAELAPFARAVSLDRAREAGETGELTARTRAELAELFAGLDELERRGADPGRHPSIEQLPKGSTIGPAIAESTLDSIAWPLTRSCSTRFSARRRSGTRKLSAIELGVVHCTQGASAAGAAGWFANTKSQGSAHDVVDAIECYRTLPPSVIPWGAPGVNGNGWHLEIAGFAEWSRAEWLRHGRAIERAAYKLAVNGRERFPMRFLTDRELADVLRRKPTRRRGVVSHRQVSRVFGGTHTDPGPHFPWDVFMGYARRFEQQLAGV